MSTGLRRVVASTVAGSVFAAGCATGAAAATAAPARDPSVVLLLEDAGCADPFDALVCNAFRRAVRAEGVTGRLVDVTKREDALDSLELIARQRHDLVVTAGLNLPDALGLTAPRRPEQLFVTFDGSRTDVPGHPDNVRGVVFRSSEAAYLAGWLAARLERERTGPDVVAVVGGIKIPAVEEFIVGFRAGARRASPAVKVLVGYSNDFVDPTLCEAIARRQIAAGAGVVFNVAGACGLGTMKAAAEQGVWAVGVDSDQSFLGPHVLTSVVKKFDAAFVKLLRELKRGALAMPRDLVMTLRDGGVGLGKISGQVPAAVRVELDDLRRRIVSGVIRVPGIVPQPR